MNIPISSSITQVDPGTLSPSGFNLLDQNVIPNENIVGTFTPGQDLIEFFAYDSNNNLISSDYNFTNWSTNQNSSVYSTDNISTINLSPDEDLYIRGFDVGDLYALYNFITPELSSSINSTYFISDISSDRTEIKITSNTLQNSDISSSFSTLISKITSSEYFDEFYINFGENQYYTAVNAQLDTTTNPYSVLIKLYEPLPTQYDLKTTLYVVYKSAETQAYKVSFVNDNLFLDNITYIKGPNTNLNIKDVVNNSTNFKNLSSLVSSSVTGSNYQLQSALNTTGIRLTPNYSINTFSDFVHFSSARQRILNFVTKVQQIQTYQGDINIVTSITGSTSSSSQISSSISFYNNAISSIISNFDGYEYFLYYTSGSDSYPKTNSIYPYTLASTTSALALNWIGSDNELNPYYGGIILSASLYDNANQNYLYYTVPEFIRDNSNNAQYTEFINMIGQQFDEIWLYTKNITNKLDNTNVLSDGIPLELAHSVINSFGYEGYGSNTTNHDNYISFLGATPSGEFTPPTGSELITNYIAVNNSGSIHYPYAIDDVSKEIFKRLYHNIIYLAKKKGTLSGLRQLINIWGVPDTILRINEYGGRDRGTTNVYDHWYRRYSYAYTPDLDNHNTPDSTVLIPWMPLTKNYISSSRTDYTAPDCIEFRFKTNGAPTGSYVSQSLLVKKSDGNASNINFDFGIQLTYNTSSLISGSYSGSIINNYSEYGTMTLFMSASSPQTTAVSSPIYLPFFDGGWWSVMLQKNNTSSLSNPIYTLSVGNKIYNGYDGNTVGYTGSTTIIAYDNSSSINNAWSLYGTSSVDGIYLGGYILGSKVGNLPLSSNIISPNAFQEFRYYSRPLNQNIFNDYIMNPRSIMGLNITGSLSSFDILNFRAPLGNELENTTSSLHPASANKVIGLITSSFIDPSTNITSSDFRIIYYGKTPTNFYNLPNTETYYLDQPSIGLRNVVNDKIQVTSNETYGNVLSLYKSIQQNYPVDFNYSNNINTLDVSFSPQDEIDDDITQTIGYENISDSISDPRFISSSRDYYPILRNISEDYFKKYSKGNIYDYIRLIKYFDNSLFKAIKNYAPTHTSVSTGVVIKQHLLERNRVRVPQVSTNYTQLGVTSKDISLSTNIDMYSFSGGTGGSVEKYNYTGSPDFFHAPISQSWLNSFDTPSGLQTMTMNSEREFYNGNYSGSNIIVSNGELDSENVFKYASTYQVMYKIKQFAFNNYALNQYADGRNFTGDLNINGVSTIPASGYITMFGVPSLPGYTNNIVTAIKINSVDNNDNNLDITLANVTSITIGSYKYNVLTRQKRNSATGFWYFTVTTNPNNYLRNPISQGDSFGNPSGNLIVLNPFIQPPFLFYNSDYDVTMNNINNDVLNSYLMEVDYPLVNDSPFNFQYILSGSATRAAVPDSNYTTKRIIIPRYEGSKNYSADYNNYTPSSSNVQFLNGDTGSWDGDRSLGKTAAIDHYPVYFAHFNSSKTNSEVFNTSTFDIDSLIEVPFNDIQGTNYKAKTIKINGSNDNLYFTANTFEKNRKVAIVYNTGLYNTNYSTIGKNTILQGGLEYQLIVGDEISKTSYSPYMNFKVPSWGTSLSSSNGTSPSISTSNTMLQTGSFQFRLKGNLTNANNDIYSVSTNYDYTSSIGFLNNDLALIHSINYAIKNQITSSVTLSYDYGTSTNFITASIGLPIYSIGQVDPNNISNYYTLAVSSSGLNQYEDFNIPFLIQRGDEIRVTWDLSLGLDTLYYSQDFTVSEVTYSPTNDVSFRWGAYHTGSINNNNMRVVPSSLIDTLIVHPDPSTFNIPSGQVHSFTIRRRNQADNRVVIFQTPPIGSQGILTPSVSGFLIPDDFNEIQKHNTLTLIDQLKGLNAF
jgi:hypothetical protein